MTRLGKYNKKIYKKSIDGLSIIMTAYRSGRYIRQALDSLIRNTWILNNENYEILVGIDGCQETLDEVLRIKDEFSNVRFYHSDTNVGTYVLSNSLLLKCRYEYVLRFDSDDIAFPFMMDTIMGNLYDEKNNKYDMLRFKFQNFYEDNTAIRKSVKYLSAGCIVYRRETVIRYGGYLPWICGADTELIERLKSVIRIKAIVNELLLRRKHGNSLTENKETGIGSELRIKTLKDVHNNHDNGITTIEMVSTELTEINND